MAISTVTSKGQVTIPKSIRDQLGLKPGDTLNFEIEEGSRLTVTPAKRRANEAYGLLYREGEEALSVEEMDAGVADYFRRKYRAR